MTRGLLVALALAAACHRGPPSGSATAVAERFMDLYFVEIDQERLLPLTDGPAREAIQHELADVAGVRAGGYTPADAHGKAFYERTWVQETGDTARMIYDVTIEHGRDRTRRHVLLSLRKLEGGWRVTSFTLRDGPAPKAP